MGVLDQQTESWNYALWMCNALGNVRRGWNKTVNDALFQQQYPDFQLRSFTDINVEVCPTYYAAQLGETVLILVSCVDNIIMAGRLIAGYELGIAPILGGENALAKEAAQYIVGRLAANHFGQARRWLLTGHSFGGMICQSLAAALVRQDATQEVKLTTFGSPREANTTNCRVLEHIDVTRWMNDNDPIPLVPPHISEAPGFSAVLTFAAAASWGRYVHTRGGVQLNPDGTWVAQETPQHTRLSVTDALGAFLVSQSLGEVTPHSLIEYRNRIALNVPPGGESGGEVVGGDWETDDGTSRGDWGDAAREATNRVFAQGETQNSVPVVIPDAYTAKVRRVGRRMWSVYWGEIFIATGPTKAKAYGLKNTFNDFLRRLQRQAVTDAPSIAAQFQQYFDVATEEGNGFQPVMQDEFPEV